MSEAPRLIDVMTHRDARGALGAVEADKDVGFPFRRFYFLYDIAPGADRGAHAHKALAQCMIALVGGFTVTLEGRGRMHRFRLDTPTRALLIPPGLWRDLTDFTPGAVCLVAASQGYDERDYIRDRAAFLAWEKSRG
jgi:hypothetical protein